MSSVLALVCDDDRPMRAKITELIEDRGAQVIAETDGSFEAIELLKRYGPNLVVLDMGLKAGSGTDVLEFVADEPVPCQIIVFTAFREMSRVASRTVRVVEKPDFHALRENLDAAIVDLQTATTTPADRRLHARTIEPPSMRSDAGVDDAAEFYRCLADAAARDALVAFDVPHDDPLRVAFSLRKAMRVQDLMIVRQGLVVALLIAGGDDGPPAVANRLGATHPDIARHPRVFVLGAHHNPSDALEAVLRGT